MTLDNISLVAKCLRLSELIEGASLPQTANAEISRVPLRP